MKKQTNDIYGMQKVMQNLYKTHFELSDINLNIMTSQKRSNIKAKIKNNEKRGKKIINNMLNTKIINTYQKKRMDKDIADIVSKNIGMLAKRSGKK